MKMRLIEKWLLNSRLRGWMLRRREIPAVLAGLDGGQSARCLEIGCGNGVGALELARRLGAAHVMAIDSDPDMIDIPIPGNDDAMRSIEIVISSLVDSIRGGMGARTEGKDDDGEPRRRSKRPAMGQATEAAPAAPEAPEAPAAE